MSFASHQLTADRYIVTHEVGAHQTGIRLDAFLKKYYHHRSREQIKGYIDRGAVSIFRNQGSHVPVGRLKPSLGLLPGDEVQVLSERKPEPPVCFDYKIIFEDEVLFVIEKPANLPVHPAGRYFFNTLLVHLKTQGHTSPLKTEREFYLVHRIDKETSGVLVLAKTREVCAHLTRQFAERSTEKRYLAIARGITPDSFTIEQSMRRSRHSVIKLKMEVAPETDGGQTALTSFKKLETAGGFSLLECHPKTGRQHQIRVHLDFAGFPIVGDKLYGIPESESLGFYERTHLTPEAEAKLLLPRHALHSAGIHFSHPITSQRLEFRSELPRDLRLFLEAQKKEPGLAQSQV